MSADKEQYEPPERIYLQPMPNVSDPLKGGAFLIVTQEGETRRYALNSTMLLRVAQGITTTLLLNFSETLRQQKKSEITEQEITAFLASLDSPDAIPTEENPSE